LRMELPPRVAFGPNREAAVGSDIVEEAASKDTKRKRKKGSSKGTP
jgi:hypothetical protein